MPYHGYHLHDDSSHLVRIASHPHVPLKDAHALPPRHVGRMHDVLPPTDSSASSSSSSRGASSSAPLSTFPPSSAALPHELEKLARALQACRAALEESGSASEDDLDDDESLDSDEDDAEELESEYLDDDKNDEQSEEDDEPAPRPDDSYHRRMRRICMWREQLACSAPASLKRKAESELLPPVQAQHSASPKRARLALAPAHVCAACGWSFPTQNALAAHGAPANPNEACRAAVAYQLEA